MYLYNHEEREYKEVPEEPGEEAPAPEGSRGNLEEKEGVTERKEEKETHEEEKEQERDGEKALEERLEALSREKEEVTGLLQRVKADFDNYRKRARVEKEEAGRYALFELMRKLLPVVDNIERAMESAGREEVGESFIEGMSMIKKQLLQIMEQEGVAEIEAEGKEFDPNLHEAVMTTEEEGVKANTVVEVFQKGYLMNDRVLRPAMVKVSSGGLAGEERSEEEEEASGDKGSREESSEERVNCERNQNGK